MRLRRYSTNSVDSSPESNISTYSASDEDFQEGDECAVQTLYECLSKCVCCKNWTKKYPKDLLESAEDKPGIKQKALVARMARNHDKEATKPLVLHSIVVQNPYLRETLTEVFKGYREISAFSNSMVFWAPFSDFYHRWEVLCQVLERQKREDPSRAAYTQLLHDLLITELEDTRTELKDLLSQRCITHSLLWTLFEPGTRIVRTKASTGEQERFYIVEDCNYRYADIDDYDDDYDDYDDSTISTGHEARIAARYVDFDGRKFGFAKAKIVIPHFRGRRAIDKLECFPASFLTEREDIEARAIARGRKLQSLHGVHYKGYSGMARSFRGRRRIRRQIDGPVMVDPVAYFDSHYNKRQELMLLDTPLPEINAVDQRHGEASPSNRRRMPRIRRRGVYRKATVRRITGSNSDDENVDELVVVNMKPDTDSKPDLTEEQLLICNSDVRGYSLKFKEWFGLDVNNIVDVTWNDEAFSNLILPDGFKNLILSSVESRPIIAGDEDIFDDIVEGKELGVTMLLVGNPGTGKTLTAKAVADKLRRPLYVLSADDLGDSVNSIEFMLEKALELVEKWNAVLLFDECDVFLQKRSMRDILDNEVVSTFLRTLESHRGIMIMTANRTDTIDHAFHSRVHLTLQYPDLDSTARADIWRRLSTQKNATSTLTDEDYARLAGLPLNGHLIRNAIRIAMRLALREKKPFGIGHLETVFRATGMISI